jgi:ethanolamine utilization cobalamin adenosyltransferase
MLYTEENVKANIRNREGKRVFFLGRGDTLTPGARDWLKREKIEILPGEQGKIWEYRLLNGGKMEEKPEHMTHLHGVVLVEKTHPQIRFRGMLDSIQAELLLCALRIPEQKQELEELLALSREIIRCEVMEEPLEHRGLGGMTVEQLRERSHFPQKYYGIPHFMPESGDGEKILLLNRLRTRIREGEIAAVAAFMTPEGKLSREDIPKALNRMSSMVYLLMIQMKRNGKL